MKIASLALLLICVVACGGVAAETDSQTAGLQHFEQFIRPLLIARCLKCHGEEQSKGGLRLDSMESILKGGDSGAAIEPHHVEDSLLTSAVRYESLEMPPDEKLSASEIAAIEQWVRLGAPWPTGETLSGKAAASREITDVDRNHWSFRPITNPSIPVFADAQDRDWCRNPIDHFVLRSLKAHQLTPAPPAEQRTLIRRAYFDLIGLPPHRMVWRRFLGKHSRDPYGQLVDRLLSHPGYGERWARHWLDLVRYAESDGFRADSYRPGAWHYRDYVIDSLNGDKPYDRFVAEQIAGDELFPNDPSAWVGTAYFRLQPYEYNQRDIVTQRQDILNDITDVTGDVFLGLGMKCARCHDHKFDPILQSDYYRLQAHFASLFPRDDALLVPPQALQQYKRQWKAWEAATLSIRDQIAAVKKPYQDTQAQAVLAKFTPELLTMYHKPVAERSPYERQLVYFIARQTREEGKPTLSAKDATRVRALEKELEVYRDLLPKQPPSTMVVSDAAAIAPPTTIPGKGSPGHESKIMPGALEVLRQVAPAMPAKHGASTTGRRTALARWLTSRENPLTARVAVNRIWQQYFGRGLVATPSDFGKLGSEPSHAELLDWLATYFMKHGWRSKPIHRLIVTSATYQQSAHHADATRQQQIDPANRLCWRSRVRRLDAEQIVDASLFVSGQLDETVGGPSRDADSRRRAIYRKIRRNQPDELLSLFDGADGINSAPRRSTTTTSPQALALLNGEFGLTCARNLANRLVALTDVEGGGLPAQVRLAYELAYGRRPQELEMQLAIRYLHDHETTTKNEGSPSRQLINFCHVLLNTNEFVYVE